MSTDNLPIEVALLRALSVDDVHHPDHCDCGGCVCVVDDDCHCDGDRCDGLDDQVDAVLALLKGGTDA